MQPQVQWKRCKCSIKNWRSGWKACTDAAANFRSWLAACNDGRLLVATRNLCTVQRTCASLSPQTANRWFRQGRWARQDQSHMAGVNIGNIAACFAGGCLDILGHMYAMLLCCKSRLAMLISDYWITHIALVCCLMISRQGLLQ